MITTSTYFPVYHTLLSKSNYHSWVRGFYWSFHCVAYSLTIREKYEFERCLALSQFLLWEVNELRQIKFCILKRKKGEEPERLKVSRDIHVAYARVVDQFVLECEHAKEHLGHEAVRRQSYAMEMLDLFAEEVMAYEGPAVEFRSKVLTPVLQRHLFGLPDGNASTVSRAIRPDGQPPTIKDATIFYLTADPLDPRWIPNYRRNAIAIPQVRWHLRILIDEFQCYPNSIVGYYAYYNSVLQNQVELMARIADLREIDAVHNGIPLFKLPHVVVIVCERLDIFYEKELERVVRHIPILSYYFVLTIFTTARSSSNRCEGIWEHAAKERAKRISQAERQTRFSTHRVGRPR